MRIWSNMKWRMAVLLILTLVLAELWKTNASHRAAAADYCIQNPRRDSNGVKIWDCVYFGNYWQEDTNGDGVSDKQDEKQPIKWRVLSVDGNDAFLLADQNLDCQEYNTVYPSANWENCTLRSWLNGYGAGSNADKKDYSNDNFLDEAFQQTEQEAIRSTFVISEDNPYWGIKGGSHTQDKIYLLSITEACDPSYGFDAEFRGESAARGAKNTEYTKAQGAYTIDTATMKDNGCWWLRSPGDSIGDAAYVNYDGWGGHFGFAVGNSNFAVRPALHLNLLFPVWKNAGQIHSDGKISEETFPTIAPTGQPTIAPTGQPTIAPTGQPTIAPTGQPTITPTGQPSNTQSSGTGSGNAEKKLNKPGKVTGLTLWGKKKMVLVAWKGKAGVSGFQIQYALNRKFTKRKKTVKAGKNAEDKIIRGLKRKKTYYVRIRAYHQNGSEKLHGKWSEVKKVKTQ